MVERRHLLQVRNRNLIGVAKLVDSLWNGTENRYLARAAHGFVERTLGDTIEAPVAKGRTKYSTATNNIIFQWAGGLEIFEHNGDAIDPRKTLDAFVQNTEELYRSRVQAAIVAVGNFSGKSPEGNDAYDKRRAAMRDLIVREIDLAKDIAVWINSLATREGFLGKRMARTVRQKLKDVGVVEPRNLEWDVHVVGSNLLQLYDHQTQERYR